MDTPVFKQIRIKRSKVNCFEALLKAILYRPILWLLFCSKHLTCHKFK